MQLAYISQQASWVCSVVFCSGRRGCRGHPQAGACGWHPAGGPVGFVPSLFAEAGGAGPDELPAAAGPSTPSGQASSPRSGASGSKTGQAARFVPDG